MTIPTDEAIAAAREAMAAYNRETAGGGEPHFPHWADDLLRALPRPENKTP